MKHPNDSNKVPTFFLLYMMTLQCTKKSSFNPVAFRMAKTPLSFGHFECNRVKMYAQARTAVFMQLFSKIFKYPNS